MRLNFGILAALCLIVVVLRRLFMKRKEASQPDVDGFEDKSKVIHLHPKPVKGKFIVLIVIVVALLAIIGSSVYQLHEDEYAVISYSVSRAHNCYFFAKIPFILIFINCFILQFKQSIF